MTDELTLHVSGMTCGSCVNHVQRALLNVSGVRSATVNLAHGLARVRYVGSNVTPEALVLAVEGAGYKAQLAGPATPGTTAVAPVSGQVASQPRRATPVLVGLMGAAGLMLLYLGIISVAESPAHAAQQLRQDLWFVLAIMAGFGLQAGLFAHLRWNLIGRSSAALPATGGGTSTVAMVACCAHHLTDLLPILGLSAAAVFLNQYRTLFMAAGLGMNLIGVGVMLYTIHRVKTRTCLPVAATVQA